jgi:copper chaperone CopZ
MLNDAQDQLVLIKIEGMHCHKCQNAIKKALQEINGVHEVEVDFPSGQASVLYSPGSVKIRELVDAIGQTGYRATSFTTPSRPDHAHP